MVANTQNSVTDISPFNNQGELLQRTASGEQEGGVIMDQFYQAGYHMRKFLYLNTFILNFFMI